MELYWSLVSHLAMVIILFLEGWFFYRFSNPFLHKEKCGKLAGIGYLAVMLVLFFVPYIIENPRIYAVAAAFVIMCFCDRRNIRQKLVLSIILYVLFWIAHGVALIPRNVMFFLVIDTSFMNARVRLQLAVYIIEELLFCAIRGVLLHLMITWIHKVYVNKKENVSKKELSFLMVLLLMVLLGYFTFSFFSNAYEMDTGNYIWNVHTEYSILITAYQLVSFSVILIAIVIQQKTKEKQREEKENIRLAEQIESMKKHIAEVEKLYSDIRGLKHEMGNHIMVMETLYLKQEKEEFQKYLLELKGKWKESVSEIRTGNPVTDVVLMEKQKEAKEKGIAFQCQFSYPVHTNVNAFDISVILNNALANAIEAAEECEPAFVTIYSYRKKNAYMVEVRNSIKENVVLDKETSLPQTSKKDKENHGFGLVNIRKVAQKYYGDFAIEQKENCFMLTILLMVESDLKCD